MIRHNLVVPLVVAALVGTALPAFALNPQPEPPGIFRAFQNLFVAPTVLRNPMTGKIISVSRLPVGLCRTQGYFNANAASCIDLGKRMGLSPQ